MVKKMFVSRLLVIIVAVSFSSFAFAANKTIKFAHIGKADAFKDAVHAAAIGFKYMMEKRSAGKFEVTIYPDQSLGSQADVMPMLKNNAVQISLASAIGFARVYPKALIMFAPYLFKNEYIAMEVANGPFGQKLLDGFTKKTGIKALAFYGGYTWMALTNNKRPIRNLKDMKGLKFRVMDPMAVAMFKSMGASAAPIAFTETYTSMQTGVVDGQTNPPFIVAAFKFNEVQKYMTLASTQWGYQLLLCNLQWYNSLSAQEKIMLRDAVTAAMDAGNGVGVLLEDRTINNLIKSGMQVNVLDAATIAQFQAVAKPAGMKFVRKVAGNQIADELLQAIAAAEKKLGYQ